MEATISIERSVKGALILSGALYTTNITGEQLKNLL